LQDEEHELLNLLKIGYLSYKGKFVVKIVTLMRNIVLFNEQLGAGKETFVEAKMCNLVTRFAYLTAKTSQNLFVLFQNHARYKCNKICNVFNFETLMTFM
jgi:hypothetical protein